MDPELESAVRTACEAERLDQAVELAIRGYGPEVLGFLVARLGDRDVAADVFSQACEDLWHSLPAFQWRCSIRTWMYKLARSAAARHTRRPINRASRRERLSQVSEVVAGVRTRTLDHLRTEVKDRFAELQAELSPEDRTLLILRIDRGLSWNDVVRVVSDEQVLDDEQISRESARLRQRFKKVKDRLRERAIEVGLLPGPT